MVVDRKKGAPDRPVGTGMREFTSVRQRLAESFEAALDIAAGRAICYGNGYGPRNESGPEPQRALFNAKFACPVCSYSIAELEPRLFLQLAVGACPGCDGLGQQDFSTPSAWSPSRPEPGRRRHQELGPAQRLLLRHDAKPWPRTTASTWRRRSSRCQPQCSRPSCTARAEDIKFQYVLDSGARRGQEGHQSTRSKASSPTWSSATARPTRPWRCAKNWHACIATQPCPDCAGTRLKREARFVRIGEGAQARAILKSAMSRWANAWIIFTALQMDGAKGDIAAKVVREISLRLKFLNDVGLNYLSLDRSAETPRAARASASAWPARSVPASPA